MTFEGKMRSNVIFHVYVVLNCFHQLQSHNSSMGYPFSRNYSFLFLVPHLVSRLYKRLVCKFFPCDRFIPSGLNCDSRGF